MTLWRQFHSNWQSLILKILSAFTLTFNYQFQMSLFRTKLVVAIFFKALQSLQGCQILLSTRYQNGENIPNGHKMYQMAINISFGRIIDKIVIKIPTSTIAKPCKIYPNWDLWFENKPYGNPGNHSVSRRRNFQCRRLRSKSITLGCLVMNTTRVSHFKVFTGTDDFWKKFAKIFWGENWHFCSKYC
jgi:hypothetical protein